MDNKKKILAILATLIFIKFFYLPWSEWATETEEKNIRLSSFNNKQKQVIAKEAQIEKKLKKHKENLVAFIDNLPLINQGEKANTLWFSLVDSVKVSDIKIYNQRVEFEDLITDDIGYITGTVSISGKASDVMQAVLALEAKSPYVFLDQLKLSRSSGSRKEDLVAQLYLGYWFSRKAEVKS